ncbi:hypothetical protein C6P40_000510 [Pichia californica]|uniref:ferric-chelate reductase (NADPH) n=1 Tax=Pichia californica TaxID=460514 RepID=A0A9P6WKH7_9ASCO|nr:hypothetical protein C6P40_000510 [[Candida] californica]
MKLKSIQIQFLLFIGWIQLASTLVIYDSHVASSCIYFLRKRSWNCSSMGGHMSSSTWECQCHNIEWLGSITNCIHDFANSTAEMNHGYLHIVKRCNGKVGTDFTVDDMISYQENATNYLKDSELFPMGTDVTYPLSISNGVFTWWYKTFRDYNYFISMCQRLGWGAVGYWIGIIGFYGVYNYIGFKYVPYQFKQTVNKYLTYRYDFIFFGLNRLEALICFFFFVLNILLCSIGYNLELNSYLSSSWFLTLDCLSFRTDIIAFSLMPVLYLMGIRNNPFQWLGLMSHNTMIKYHKFIAIIFFILALIHSIIWTAYARSSDGGGFSVWAADAYFYWGIVGTITVGLMFGFSIEIVRNIYYEIFLFFHLSFSVLFIAAMWKHCETLGWMSWVYSMVAILVFDRVCRIFRIFQNGLVNKVKIDIYNEEMIKLEFTQPTGLIFYPGSYVYLHFLEPFYSSWQSHPFSLIRSTKFSNKLIIYLKCKKGITRKLKKNTLSKEYIKVLIDGPYGNFPVSTKNDNKFDEIIGIGGGLGISSILSIFNYRVEYCEKNIMMKNYKLNWLINDLKQLDMIKENLEWLVNKGIKVVIYFTKYEGEHEDYIIQENENILSSDDSNSTDIEKTENKNDNNVDKNIEIKNHKELIENNFIILKYGKPSMDELLPSSEDIKRRVYACGPNRLIKSIRNQVNFLDELQVENHTW